MEQPASYTTGKGEFWYLPSKGKYHYHRLNGPAVEWVDGTRSWWVNGKRHRLDGPAVELVEGKTWWFVDGQALDAKGVEEWIKENSIDLTKAENQLALILMWT